MGRGFMRQSVHPMEGDADGENRHKLDDDWQDLATENSSEIVQPETTEHAHNCRGPSFGLDATMAQDHMTPDPNDGAARPPLVTRNSNLKVNGTSDPNGHEFEEDDLEGTEVLASPQAGSGNDYNVAKTGRQLTFADETGGMLVEMNYSNRTHYSKQAGPGMVQGVPKGGCCILQ